MPYTTSEYLRMYTAKRGSVEDCLTYIRSHDTLGVAGDCNEPEPLLEKFHTIVNHVEDVVVYKGRTGNYKFLNDETVNGHINTAGFFYGDAWRAAHKSGVVSLIPTDLCDFATFVSQTRPVTVFVAAVSPMDKYGNFNVGLSQMWEREFLATADRILLEVNSNLPSVAGGLRINIKDVTCFYESDHPIMEVASKEPTPDEKKIAQYCRSLMHDGDCIQLGIGSLPNALASEMMDLKDLGIHTEMFTSAMGEMIRTGVATGERKQIDVGVHIGTFAGGDKELYRTLGEIPTCRITSCSYANNPAVIMKNDNMVSVNTCIEMDITGQVCSESIGPKQYSGAGGAMDFAYGALHSKGGRGILAFLSTTKNGTISKIKCSLTPGSVVTIPRTYVDYIVTEYGIAHLRGRTVRERTEALINIAHPDFREELRQQARELFYI